MPTVEAASNSKPSRSRIVRLYSDKLSRRMIVGPGSRSEASLQLTASIVVFIQASSRCFSSAVSCGASLGGIVPASI